MATSLTAEAWERLSVDRQQLAEDEGAGGRDDASLTSLEDMVEAVRQLALMAEVRGFRSTRLRW